MTKDQIIEKQSEIIRELLAIGKAKYQEIFDLFCVIEKMPKDKEEIVKEPLPDNVLKFTAPVKRICPCCKTRERAFSGSSGKYYSYCRECMAEKNKKYQKPKSRAEGLSDRDLSAIKALETG